MYEIKTNPNGWKCCKKINKIKIRIHDIDYYFNVP